MWPHHSWLKLFHASPTRKALNKKAQSLGRVYAMALSSKAPQPLCLPSYPRSRSQGLDLSPQGPGASGQPFAWSPPILPLLTPQTDLFTLSATGTACSYLRAFAHDCFTTWAKWCLLRESHVSSFTSFRFCTNVTYQRGLPWLSHLKQHPFS